MVPLTGKLGWQYCRCAQLDQGALKRHPRHIAINATAIIAAPMQHNRHNG